MHSRRLPFAALLLTLLGLLAGILAAPPAGATSSLLCKGFAACEKAGYSSYGYGPDNYRKMWWRMYSGHNCTNYMAYRMIKAGLPTERPWSGSGDARNWGVVFKSKVDQTPMIGSVAWWSSNHVAYVQRVIDKDTIVISEDHYGGDFDWRKIVRTGGGWPTGFIHLADEAIQPVSAPKIIGTPQVDAELTATSGAWKQSGVTFTYQWTADGKAVPGATTTRYTPTAAQVGDVIAVKVVASKANFRKGSNVSAASAPTAPGVIDVTADPVITGYAKVGATLTAVPPSWTPTPTTTSWVWFANGIPIKGQTGPQLTLTADQLDKRISAAAVGDRTGYRHVAAHSVATAPVGPEKLSLTAEPTLKTGTPYIGRAYTVTPGTVEPSGVTTRYQWSADGVVIKGATGATYTPTAADLSKHLAVKISYTKPGYTTIVRSLKAPYTVKGFPRIYLDSKAAKSVTVHVVADGVGVVGGKITLVGPGGQQVTRDLKDGKAVITASWLKPGNVKLTVNYLGTYRVVAGTRTATVPIR